MFIDSAKKLIFSEPENSFVRVHYLHLLTHLECPVPSFNLYATLYLDEFCILQDGATALYIASQNDHSTIVQLLIEAGSSLDVQVDVSYFFCIAQTEAAVLYIVHAYKKHVFKCYLVNLMHIQHKTFLISVCMSIKLYMNVV